MPKTVTLLIDGKSMKCYNLYMEIRYGEAMEYMKKVYVMIGNYGSGKTELALNFAFNAAAQGEKTELIDLDMVNTYFRLAERGKMTEMKEIRLVSPNFACSGVETLSLPAEVSSAFAMDWDTVIFDVGGDSTGSTALGRYHNDFMELEEGALQVLNVVNVRRPMAGTPDRVIRLQQDMQVHSRLNVTGMINNSNLAQMTTADDLREGYKVVKEVSERTGIPVMFTSGRKEILEEFLADGPDMKYVGKPIAIDTYMQRDWESWIRSLDK